MLLVDPLKENKAKAEHLFYARDIQRALFPKDRHFKRTGLDFAVYHRPKDILSGDFYWVGCKNELVFAAVGDCTGHGISAALLTVLGLNLLNYVCFNKDYYLPGQILKEIDKKWIEAFQDDYYDFYNNDWCDISFLFIDKSKNEIIFSGAHLHLLIIKKDGSIKTLKGERYPIGGWQLENQRTFHSKLMDIEAGDIYCIFTDGIIHQFGGINDKKFGYHRLRKILKEHSSKNATEIINEFEYYFLEWQSGYDITDDQTLMVLKF